MMTQTIIQACDNLSQGSGAIAWQRPGQRAEAYR